MKNTKSPSRASSAWGSGFKKDLLMWRYWPEGGTSEELQTCPTGVLKGQLVSVLHSGGGRRGMVWMGVSEHP